MKPYISKKSFIFFVTFIILSVYSNSIVYCNDSLSQNESSSNRIIIHNNNKKNSISNNNINHDENVNSDSSTNHDVLLGVDINSTVSKQSMECLYNENKIDFVIVNCWNQHGLPNPTCQSNIKMALISNITNIDISINVCYRCGEAFFQANELIAFLQSRLPKFQNPNFIAWIDVTQPSQWAQNDQQANANYFTQFVSILTQKGGIPIGILTTGQAWLEIMGIDYTAGSAYPLYYSQDDGQTSFADFSPFNGWTIPTIKQYKIQQQLCGVNVNLDFQYSEKQYE